MLRLAWLTLIASFAYGLPAAAQDWPNKIVRIVVPTAAGGPADAVARIVANAMTPLLSQPIIVENKPGAGGNIAVESVSRASADGHTLLLGLSTLVSNPIFFQGSRDPKELAPVIQLSSGYFVLLASNQFEARKVSDLLSLMQSKQGGVRCGSSGGLATLACELLRLNPGSNVTIANYRGSADAIRDLQNGEIDIMLDFVNSAISSVNAGRGRALAVASAKAGVQPFPDVEAMNVTIPNFEFYGWHAIFAPRETPAKTLAEMNAAFNKALASPDLKSKFEAASLDVVGGPAKTLGDRVELEVNQFARIAAQAGIKPQ
ncbi:MAG: tripartite tricarboxylate transporter substrate binding protein [Hyphomicrobiales bacterium]|nr:tripartite tricarboxylate transporter substrate binding protein [Hyphomicrobiales bacterium]